jgi:crotonobetainyl-CoA:carnitine CoA-transferase CaiB-like acyl-CoA transferase
MASAAPLDGIRVIEASALGPAAITMPLVDLGADVIKVEPPSGDYIREMTWPIVEGVSLMHLHINRGKKSVVLDLRTQAGVAVFKELAKDADVVVEAMRPGGLARRGLGFEDLRALNPTVVFCTISGYGMTGPYKDFPAHGIAFDTWAGIVNVAHDPEGYPYLAEHASIGIHAGPLFGALGILAAVIRARATGEGSFLEIAQSDAAAAMDWYRSETWLAYRRPESEVTGNKADGYERRAPGTAGMKEGVRYQVYEASDGRYVLFMASEQAFWRNFCEAVGRMDLYERWPGSKFADHARGNRELQAELRAIFATRTSLEWLELGGRADTPIAPVNTPETLLDDPQFHDRFPLYPADELGAEELPGPIRFVGEQLPRPAKAPTVGQHTEDVVRRVLGWDDARLAGARAQGAFG